MRRPAPILLLPVFLLLSALVAIPLAAAGPGAIQKQSESLGPGEVAVYVVQLAAGETLYAHAVGTGGNLDPKLGVAGADFVAQGLRSALDGAMREAIDAGRDPMIAIEQLWEQGFLTWDDDGGGGQAAALQFRAPAAGVYRLAVTGGVAETRQTFGEFELLAGIDAPEVLTGEATPSGEPFLVLDAEASNLGAGTQEITGELTPEMPSARYPVRELNPGDTLYVRAEATSGDLAPILQLQTYSGKRVRTANVAGKARTAQLEYTTSDAAAGYTLVISAAAGEERATSGGYRLLVGRNDPAALTGEATPTETQILQLPIVVDVGINLEKIINVNEQDEYFTAVFGLMMDWQDPALAFNPDECGCSQKVLTVDEFEAYAVELGARWPDFEIYNQQGEAFPQQSFVRLLPDGSAVYFQRMTADFTVDFNFRRYPLDTQDFTMRLDMLYPIDRYVLRSLESYNDLNDNLGEDEFIIDGFTTGVSEVKTTTGMTVSSFDFRFSAPRHLDYYIFQIFVPVLLIILVSWVTFFLKDYQMRIEVASANLLLFIAFSFSLSDNYPRLGYLTFLDAVMAATFVITAAVVIYNVLMRRLEATGQLAKVERIDDIMDWVYPVLYIGGFILLYFVFMHTGAG